MSEMIYDKDLSDDAQRQIVYEELMTESDDYIRGFVNMCDEQMEKFTRVVDIMADIKQMCLMILDGRR